MKGFKIQYICFLCIMGCFIFPNNSFAQKVKETEKKVVITKKTIDKDGNETVEKIIKEGEDAENFDIPKYLDAAEANKKGVDVQIRVEVDKDKTISKDITKTVEVTVDGDDVIINEGGEKMVIKIDEGVGKKEIKTEDGKHIIIMTKEGEDADVNKVLEEMEIDIEEMSEGGEKEIRIIKTRKGEGASLGVMIDPNGNDVKILEVVKGNPAEKAGLKKGDIIKRIDQHHISNYDELTKALLDKKDKKSVVVLFDRDGQLDKVNVILDQSIKEKRKIIKKKEK